LFAKKKQSDIRQTARRKIWSFKGQTGGVTQSPRLQEHAFSAARCCAESLKKEIVRGPLQCGKGKGVLAQIQPEERGILEEKASPQKFAILSSACSLESEKRIFFQVRQSISMEKKKEFQGQTPAQRRYSNT